MRNTWWFHWAGRLVALGALSLAGTSLHADEDKPEAAKPEADKPPASERKEDPKESAGGIPAHSIRRREAPAPLSEYWLGIETNPAGGVIRDQLNLPEGQGLVVASLVPESPADKAGLKKHDILLLVNDKPLDDVRQLIEVLRAADGSAINFKLLRGGKEQSLSITPGKRAEFPGGHGGPRRERLEQDVQLWREFAEKGGEPFRMQFFHPGMVLPPGAPPRPPLPEGMRVTITREGKKPAEIEVTQKAETWKGTEEELSKAPEKFRGPIAIFLGSPLPTKIATLHLMQKGPGGVYRLEGAGQPEGGPDQRPEGTHRPSIRQPGAGPGPGDIDQRLQDVIREVEKLRQDLHNRRAGGPKGPPGDGQPKGEDQRPPRDRSENDSPPPEK